MDDSLIHEHLRCRHDSPYRPVYWKWELSRRVVERKGELRSPYLDDPSIRRAARYRRALDTCRTYDDLYSVFDAYPDLTTAHEIFRGAAGADKGDAFRNELEARILARQPLDEIDMTRTMPSGTAKAYEQTFFNVLDRIEDRSYILHRAVGEGAMMYTGLSSDNYGLLWKLYGYVRGLETLEFLITTFADWYQPSGSEEVLDGIKEDYRHTMRRKVSMAARMIPVTEKNSGRLIELHTQLEEVESALGSGDPARIQANISAMFQHVQFMVQSPSAAAAIKDHNTLPAALRAAEMVAAAAGKAPDMGRIASLKFPVKEDDPAA